MTTVLPDLERDLIAGGRATRRLTTAQARARHVAGWVGRRSRPARLLFGMAVVSAAVAAAATLVGSSSLPLSRSDPQS